jgi:DNA-binding response OmpR family regulator
MRILFAEGEMKVARHLCQGLSAERYAVETAADGDEAIWLAENTSYDIILLDVTMPGKDGFTMVRYPRRKNILTPVIFITARGEGEDRVRGRDAGRDDHLTKPFSLSELLARVRARLRRQHTQSFNVLRVGDLLNSYQQCRAYGKLRLITHASRRKNKSSISQVFSQASGPQGWNPFAGRRTSRIIAHLCESNP